MIRKLADKAHRSLSGLAGRTFLLVGLVSVGFSLAAYAQQTPEATRRIPVGQRKQIPTPPPLPIDQQTPPPGMASPASGVRKLPPIPSYAEWKRTRGIKSASGGTICVTYNAVSGCAPSTQTQIIPQGGAISWRSQTLPNATANNYQDYQLDPDVTTPAIVGAAYTGPAGASHAVTASKTGVYVFGSLNIARNQWDALEYTLVGTKADIETYSDSSLTTLAQTFTAGSAIYMNADSLTPTDRYAFGVENTSITGACVFTFPSSSQPANVPCSLGSGTLTGANAPGGSFFATWNTPAALAAGAYSVTLYDQTTGKRLAQQQISIKGSAETANLTFNATFGSAGTKNGVTKVAFNGPAPYQDANVTFVHLTGVTTGLTANRVHYFTVSDPNGQVVSSAQNANSGAGGGFTAANFFTFNSQQSPQYFGPNTYTVAVIDKSVSNNPPTIASVRSIQVLGYTALVTWSDGSIGSSLAGSPNPTMTKGIILKNDGAEHFGKGNADLITAFTIVGTNPSNGGAFPYMTWTNQGSVTSCGANCSQQTVQDSNFKSWLLQLNCTGAGCALSTSVGNRTYTLTATSVDTTYGLPSDATLTIPTFDFRDQAGGSQCGGGGGGNSSCVFSTTIKPLDGVAFSANGGSSTIANDIQILSNPAATYNLQGDISVYGTRSGATVTTNRLVQGNAVGTAYAPRYSHMLYDNGQPRATTISPIKQILALHLVNASSTTTQDISNIAITFPTTFSIASMSVDSLNSQWVTQACASPAPLVNTLCLNRNGPGGALTPAGRAYGVHSDYIYLDVDPPSGSFVPTSVSVLVTDVAAYSAVATGANVAVAAGSPATVGPLDLAAYSLNSTLMVGATTPSTIGQSSSGTRSQTVGWQFQNTPSGSDAEPDAVDAILVAVDPQTTTTVGLSTATTTWTTSPSTWTLLGTWGGGASTLYYLFGLCSAQYDQTAIPTGANPWGLSLTACSTSPSETSDSLLASGLFTAQATVQVGVGQGSVTGKLYAHGSNGNGWSASIPFTLAVTNTDSGSSGFSKVNGAAVTTGSQPTVGGDPSPTIGSAFEYTFTNNGNTNITQVNVKIPGPDTSGASDQESNTVAYFKITDSSATVKTNLVYTGSGGSLTQCTAATVTNPTIASTGPVVVNNGSLVLTGCSIPPGYSVVMKFNALSPATANSTFQWSATFNGTGTNVAAAESWFSDQQIKITLSATMSVILKPSTSPSGTSTPSFSCAYSLGGAGTASLNSYLDFGSVASGATETCTDAIMISLATNAGGTVGWSLYVTADGNPSNVVQFLVDSARSSTGNNVTYSNTSFTAVGTGSPGQALATRASGNASSRTPYDVVTSWRVTPVDAIAHTQNLTFTFVAN